MPSAKEESKSRRRKDNQPASSYRRVDREQLLSKVKKGFGLADMKFVQCDFSKIEMNNSRFTRCSFAKSTFEGAKLNKSVFILCDFRGANLKNASCVDAQFGNSDLRGADFTGANLERASLRGAEVDGAIFKDANMRGIDEEECHLDLADLKGAKNLPLHHKSALLFTLSENLNMIIMFGVIAFLAYIIYYVVSSLAG
jgi:uncharacterized protein YjbI with pentapeptide repeats